MKSRMFLASLLAGATSMLTLTAGEQSRQSKQDDARKASQLQEKKVEQPLRFLRRHCQKLLDIQIAVARGTEALHKVIEGTPDKKARAIDRQAALKLSDAEKDIIAEATKTIAMLKAGQLTVAVIEVVQGLRDDMKRVQRRLTISDVGIDTQAIEQDIIDTLKEMIRSLKKG
jgi:hypothetical protein